MRTTLNLPDALMREIKIRAASTDRRLTDVLTELIRKGLAREALPSDKGVPYRAGFPHIKASKGAKTMRFDADHLATLDRKSDLDSHALSGR
jgi:plasmid stability protein